MTRGAMRRGALALATLAAAAALALAPSAAHAQLVSPGKLAAPHAELEGMSNCTKCHDLGKRGASDAKCLACHVTLRTRIEAKEGLHATFTDRTCASCHKDHFGTDFALIRFDTAGFDHRRTGYELKLAHRTTACRECHAPSLVADADVKRYAAEHGAAGRRWLARTWLGLGTGCMDCHRDDNVHGTQFGTRPCTACHTEETWEKAPRFDHDSSRYVLTGRHRTVRCEQCHKPATIPGAAKPTPRYAGLRFSACTSCHADHHKGAMKQPCESCHDTQSWTRLKDRRGFEAGFDHAATAFPLRGAHATARCATCHAPAENPVAGLRITLRAGSRNAMYPAPVAASCLSCHVDAHDSTFVRSPGGADCANCHNETTWLPSSYDLGRHNRESWALTGAHVAVACAACHPASRPGGPPRFRLGTRTCESCHRTDDPHAGQFAGRACESCHVTETFRIASFDHARTRYPLDGAHAKVACAKCHTVTTGPGGTTFVRYRPLETTCRACHGATIPRRP